MLRLFFEPKPGTNVNHNKMFKHYADNYLSETAMEYGGIISMDSGEKVNTKFEPVYQYISETADDIESYVARNPMEGYYIHVYTQKRNENYKHRAVYG